MKLGRVKFNDNLLVVVKIASDNHLVVSEIINDFGLNRFRKYGRCCPMWTTNHKIGNGCDTMTQRLPPVLNI